MIKMRVSQDHSSCVLCLLRVVERVMVMESEHNSAVDDDVQVLLQIEDYVILLALYHFHVVHDLSEVVD